MKKRLAVLASGAGSTFEALTVASKASDSNFEVVLLIVNTPKALALEKAERLGVKSLVHSQKNYSSFEDWDESLSESLKKNNIQFIALAGFLKKIGPVVIKAFPEAIVNTHPSLLPKHGGQGMYGDNVHKAVIESGDKKSGVSIHFVNSEYDRGKIIATDEVDVDLADNYESLAEKIKSIEKVLYINTLNILMSK